MFKTDKNDLQVVDNAWESLEKLETDKTSLLSFLSDKRLMGTSLDKSSNFLDIFTQSEYLHKRHSSISNEKIDKQSLHLLI